MKKYKFILLIDDDEVSNYLTEITLKTEGLAEKIETALNGEEGLSKLKNIYGDGRIEKPELILLDISMPVLDGFGFLQKFNDLELTQKPKVVILTSSRNRKDMAKIKNYNIAGYLNKPLSADEFRYLVNKN